MARCLAEARRAKAGNIMFYTYIIQSINEPKRHYVGSTDDLKSRVEDHNAGRSTHTSKHRPWKVVWYCAFPTRQKAESFERYLKTASGRVFQKKRL